MNDLRNDLQGLWLPLLTPFRNGALDETSLRRLVARYADGPIDGLILAATSGEGVLTTFLRSLVSRSSLVIALYGRSQTSACGHGEHVSFLNALEARNGERAALLMAQHLDHIFGDLDLSAKDDEPVDVVAVLKARLAVA